MKRCLMKCGPSAWFALAWLGVGLPAGAGTFTWTHGGADTLWSDGANWNQSGAAPGGADDAVCSNSAGTVTLGTGTQAINNVTVRGTGAWTWSGTNLYLGGIFNYNMNGGSAGDSTFSAPLSGGGAVQVTGGYRLILNNASNSYTGGTTLSSGWLNASGANTIGTGLLTINGGRLSGANTGTTYTNAVVLGGNAAFGWASDGATFTGPVTVMCDCTLTSTTWVVFGSGPAFSGNYALRFVGPGSNCAIKRDNTGWLGSVIMELNAGNTLFITDVNSCGTNLTLRSGTLQPPGSSDITLAGTTAVTLDGNFAIGWVNTVSFNGPATLTGNRTLSMNKDSHFYGAFSSTNRYTLTKAATGGKLYIAGNNSAYTGDWAVAAGSLYFSATNSVGNGQVSMASGTGVNLDTNSDWTLTNNFSGAGTIYVGTYNGNTTRTLTLAGGTLTPGSATNAGTLSVDNGRSGQNAHVAFANNGAAYASLMIGVMGTNAVAGTDYGQLKLVKGNLGGLGNCDLVVNVSNALTSVGGSLVGKTMIIATNVSGTVSGGPFHSVTVTPGWTATVTYSASFVTLGVTPAIYWTGVGVSNITATTAEGGAVLDGTNADVSLFWDTADRGTTNPAAWANTNVYGANISTGFISGVGISNLVVGQSYVCRFYGTNTTYGYIGWSAPAAFSPSGAPTVDNDGGVANLAPTAARLQGTVLAGNPDPFVWIFWGTSDGSTNKGSWNLPAVSLGARGVGGFYGDVSGLSSGQQYWYRCYVSNVNGDAWAPVSTNFTAPVPATYTWTGGAGADTSWSNATNWQGNVAPRWYDSAVFSNNAGTVTIGAGAQAISNVTVSGSGNWTWSGANALNLGGVFSYNPSSGSADSTFSASLSGAGSVQVLSGFRLTLNSSTYSGGTVVSGGWLQVNNASAIGTGSLTLRGGRLSTWNGGGTLTNSIVLDGDSAFGWSNDGPTFTGPVTINRDCTLTPATWVTFGSGPAFSGNYALRFAGSGSATVSRDNTGWLGSLIMEMASVGSPLFGVDVNSCGTNLTLRSGILHPNPGANITLSSSTAITLDGDFRNGWNQVVSFNGPVSLTGNRMLTVASSDSHFYGPFSSTNRFTLTTALAGASLYIAGNNNAYTGDWSVASGPLYFAATNSVGIGKVSTATGAVARLNVNTNWTLPNDLAGGGTVQVGDGTLVDRTCTLAAGNVTPGTATNAGILTVQNAAGTNYNAHVVLTNSGAAYASLTIDVLGTNAVAGTDHDQWHVAKGNVSGLANADLFVNVAPALGKLNLAGQTMTVLVTDNGAISGTFHSVHFTPLFGAKVNYTANAVTLSDLAYRAPGTMVFIR